MNIQNMKVVKTFDKIASILELEGANPYRIRAYYNAARMIENLSKPLTEMIQEGFEIKSLKGIGDDLSKKIKEILNTGSLKFLEELEKVFPKDLLKMQLIEGLGPKRIKRLHEELGISTFKELKDALEAGKVAELKGFSENTQNKILKEVLDINTSALGKRYPRYEIESIADSLVNFLTAIPNVYKVEVAGSYRRKKETVGDLDILVSSNEGKDVMDNIVLYKDIKKIIAKGDTKTTVRLNSGLQVDIRVINKDSFGSALHYFTGSKYHNIEIRKRAIKKDLKVNEYGIFKGENKIGGETEQDIFTTLEMKYIEPELRENLGEIQAALANRLPKLIQRSDIRGDLHTHTHATDGSNTILEMAKAAKDLNYKYIAITDHSKRVTIANGLNEKSLLHQIEEIDKINETLKGFKVLKGIEVDILRDGNLDLSNGILSKLDICVCAIHYNRTLSEYEMTERVIKAMDNINFNVFAHPTGRLINKRKPYNINMETIMIAAKERGCIIELNSHPWRLDIDDHYCKMAKEIGTYISISTDAHNVEHLKYMRLGINQARRGWLESDNVINTLKLSELYKILKRNI